MLKIKACLFVLAILMPLSLNAKIDDFQKEISAFQSAHILNGSFVIKNSQGLCFREQYGFADIALEIPFSPQQQFPIASISKQFTACAILLLHEDQLLTLDASIVSYLGPKHPIWQGEMPTWAEQVTIHQLLTHSSGIVSYTNENIADISDMPDNEVVPYIISYIKDKPLAFKPGEQFEYNNTGFLLLSIIIEELSPEKDMSDFFQHRIFEPLNMNNSFLPDLATERNFIQNINKIEPFPKRYIANLFEPKTSLKLVNEVHLEMPLLGGGGMISTLDDLIKWNEALYNGKILSAESLSLMTSIQIKGNHPFFGPIQYGYGFYIDNADPENVIYYHGGWLQGVRAQLSFSAKHNTSIAYLSNVSPDESQTDEEQHLQVKALSDLGLRLHRIAIQTN